MSTLTGQAILVLGAYGEAGEAVVQGLVAQGLEVLAAGRRPEKLALLKASCPAIQTVELDALDTAALAGAIRRAGLVINCIGPYIGSGLEIAQTAVGERRCIIDLASEQEHHRRLQALAGSCEERGVTVLTGAGAYPGVSGLLLEALLTAHPGASAAQLALITGPPADPTRGTAQLQSGLAELAHLHQYLQDGQLVRVRPGRRARFVFPDPFGECAALTWPQLEILEAASTKRLSSLSTFAALGGHSPPPAILLRAAGWLRPTPGSWTHSLLGKGLRILQRPPAPDDPTTNHGAILVRVEDTGTVYETAVLATDLPAATAWLPVFAARQWALGSWKRGVVAAPMSFFDHSVVAAELPHLGHMDITRWDEGAAGPDPDAAVRTTPAHVAESAEIL